MFDVSAFAFAHGAMLSATVLDLKSTETSLVKVDPPGKSKSLGTFKSMVAKLEGNHQEWSLLRLVNRYFKK